MEITVKIEGLDGLEGAIHTLAQVLANYEMPVQMEGKKVAEKVEPEKEQPKQEEEQPDPEPEPEKEAEPSAISLETVRGKLAELAQSGKQKQVKALITEMGAKKLTDVTAEKYPELLEKVEGLL